MHAQPLARKQAPAAPQGERGGKVAPAPVPCRGHVPALIRLHRHIRRLESELARLDALLGVRP